MCSSRESARLDWKSIPLLAGVGELAASGYITGASGRNWSGYGDDVRIAAPLGDLERNLLTDPQTSGGLLVSCAPEAVDEVLAIFAAEGFDTATVIGEMIETRDARPAVHVV